MACQDAWGRGVAVELEQGHSDSSAEALIRTLYNEHGDTLLAHATRLVQELLQEALSRAGQHADVLDEAKRKQPEQTVTCQRRGRLWVVELGHRAAFVQHGLGMTYIAALVANPGREIAAVEFVAGRGLARAVPPGGFASSA